MLRACVGTGLQAQGQRPLSGEPASRAPAPTAPWAAWESRGGPSGTVRGSSREGPGPRPTGPHTRPRGCAHTHTRAHARAHTHTHCTSQATIRVPICSSPARRLTVPQARHCPGDMHTCPPCRAAGVHAHSGLVYGRRPHHRRPALARGWQRSPRASLEPPGEAGWGASWAGAPLAAPSPPGPQSAHLPPWLCPLSRRASLRPCPRTFPWSEEWTLVPHRKGSGAAPQGA